MSIETIFETYARTVCNICKNKEQCQEELRLKLDNTIKCDSYEKTLCKCKNCKKNECVVTAKQSKPVMKGLV